MFVSTYFIETKRPHELTNNNNKSVKKAISFIHSSNVCAIDVQCMHWMITALLFNSMFCSVLFYFDFSTQIDECEQNKNIAWCQNQQSNSIEYLFTVFVYMTKNAKTRQSKQFFSWISHYLHFISHSIRQVYFVEVMDFWEKKKFKTFQIISPIFR